MRSLKKLPWRRIIVMLIGLFILSFGIMMFKLSTTGNDPSTAFVLAICVKVGIDLSIMLPVVNCALFIFEILLGRKFIGIGTFANWFGIGPMTSLLITWFSPLLPAEMPAWLCYALMAAGVLVLSLGASLYQTADLGIAPYDSLALIFTERSKKLPYFWCRIIVDALFTVMAVLLGGLAGLGTLLCSVGLGPFIAFFNRHVSERLCGTAQQK